MYITITNKNFSRLNRTKKQLNVKINKFHDNFKAQVYQKIIGYHDSTFYSKNTQNNQPYISQLNSICEVNKINKLKMQYEAVPSDSTSSIQIRQ